MVTGSRSRVAKTLSAYPAIYKHPPIKAEGVDLPFAITSRELRSATVFNAKILTAPKHTSGLY